MTSAPAATTSTTMTTERCAKPASRATSEIGPTSREWKLYLLGVLGVVYALAWITLSGPAPQGALTTEATAVSPAPSVPAPPPGATTALETAAATPSAAAAGAVVPTGADAREGTIGTPARRSAPRRRRVTTRLPVAPAPAPPVDPRPAPAPSVAPMVFASPRPALAPIPERAAPSAPLVVRRTRATRVRTRSS